ncbi:MAG: hypothetical protein WBX19_15325 [Terracidiphilus sp.]|jgi:hypothetical protein
MTHPILSRIPFLGKYVDERFLEHRRRSSSLAAIAGVCVAGGIFEYRIIAQHVIVWDLFAVVAVMALVKMGMFTWFRLND